MSTNRRRTDSSDLLYRGLVYATIAFLVATIIVPLVFIVSVSFRPPTEFFGEPHLIPHDPTLQTWVTGFNEIKDNLVNSLFVAAGTAIIALLITIPGAYAFARTRFPGRKVGFYLIVGAMLFPYIVLIIPVTSLWHDLGLFNTIHGLWIAYQIFVVPFAMWILRDFFESLPANLEEAAQVYGCTQFSAFVRVVLPLSAPGIVAVGFLAFLVGWNDFLFSNLLTTGFGPRPAVPVLFQTVSGSSGERVFWGKLMVEVLIIGTPPTVLYVFSRRYLSEAFAA
ncbi:carbohydrate ABC transporter permease [Halocatena marina]|uniref:Carbohydrate ABC transporter permease n=1 Tax=Halocatena marina TaxID=2934937 RepID=A0ABD5YT43_9EURY|nr:carbohydrate ABC transporter permease [Halocatena marina]